MLNIYRALSKIASPFLKRYLQIRLKKGRENPDRLTERFGEASCPRPLGKLIWFHAASVGESLSLLKIISVIQKRAPQLALLVTTGTVTSAQMMDKKLPAGVIHQYIPLDVPHWIDRFLDYWQPSLVAILESELWPNLFRQIHSRKIPLALLNASMSEPSYKKWSYFPRSAHKILSYVEQCLTPSSITKNRLEALGAEDVHLTVNLKAISDPLDFDSKEAKTIQEKISTRKVWAAASTHSGEETIILDTHLALKKRYTDLLTILAPRHPERIEEVINLIKSKGLTVTRRSLGQIPQPNTDIWLIDTLGDLGLVYSLVDIAFVGGSFIPLGGHNPMEPIQLNSLVLHGPYDDSFRDHYRILAPCLIKVSTPEDLEKQLSDLIENPKRRNDLIKQGQEIIQQQQAGLEKIVQLLLQKVSSYQDSPSMHKE